MHLKVDSIKMMKSRKIFSAFHFVIVKVLEFYAQLGVFCLTIVQNNKNKVYYHSLIFRYITTILKLKKSME